MMKRRCSLGEKVECEKWAPRSVRKHEPENEASATGLCDRPLPHLFAYVCQRENFFSGCMPTPRRGVMENMGAACGATGLYLGGVALFGRRSAAECRNRIPRAPCPYSELGYGLLRMYGGFSCGILGSGTT